MLKILNKDLFDDERDYKIARLELAIKHFKEYDKKRTEQMSRLMEQVNYLRECVAYNGDEKALHDKVARQRKEIARLNAVIKANKLLTDIDSQGIVDAHKMKDEIERLKKREKNHLQTISELIQRLNNAK